MIPRFKTMRLTRIAKPFDDPDFVWELKHDGFRSLAYIDNGRCQLVSRRNLTYRSFDKLKAALAQLRVKNAVLDGELICLDAAGRSIFNQLLYRQNDPAFYAFDLLWLNGVDLRQLPLWKRKRKLEPLIKAAQIPSLLFAHHVEGQGCKLFEMVCEQNLEGIVAKRRESIYTAAATRSWLKIKNGSYTQTERRRELFDGFKRTRSTSSGLNPK